MPKRCLLLALGNDILKDDGVGLAAASLLRSEFKGAVDIVEASGTGLALLELLAGYDRALLLDAIFTGNAPPGTVLEFSPLCGSPGGPAAGGEPGVRISPGVAHPGPGSGKPL
jgi:Ni,Fe-hydrogenase maturation factor